MVKKVNNRRQKTTPVSKSIQLYPIYHWCTSFPVCSSCSSPVWPFACLSVWLACSTSLCPSLWLSVPTEPGLTFLQLDPFSLNLFPVQIGFGIKKCDPPSASIRPCRLIDCFWLGSRPVQLKSRPSHYHHPDQPFAFHLELNRLHFSRSHSIASTAINLKSQRVHQWRCWWPNG